MNKRIILATALATMSFAPQAGAVTIAGIENVNLLDGSGSVTTSNNNFITVTSTSSGFVPANDSSITEVLTDGGDAAMATYVLTLESDAYIDITFGDSVTGADELVFFFAGGLDSFGNPTYSFDIDINADGILEPAGTGLSTFIPLDGDGLVTTITDVDGYSYTLTAAIIDLAAFGLTPGDSLDTFSIYLGNDTYPALSGVGYIDGVVVPLPLPALLFTSGLGLLGFIGRWKQANR